MLVRTLTVTALACSAALVSGAVAAAQPTVADPAPGAFAPGRVLVQYRPGVAPAAVERGLGASLASEIPALRTRVLKVPAGAEAKVVAALQRSGKVTFAERDAVVTASDVTPDDPSWPKQWSMTKVHAPAAWGSGTGSSAVTVAVLDSGLDVAQQEYAGRVVSPRNVLTGTADVTDDNSHGSAATGVALAAGNNSFGVAGVCWSCSVMPVKVLGADGTGTDSGVAAGITWAVDHGAKVLNLSLGSTTSSSTASNAVAYARSKGVLVVAAAGNNSSTAPFYPAAYPGVLSVAATDASDALYSYSDSGSWVSVAAPGTNYSVWPSGSVFSFGGTSSASPVVAGLAGLLLSSRPTASADEVAQAIRSTTVPLTAGTVATGRVDAAAAVQAFTGSATTPAPSPSPTATASPTPAPTAAPATPTPTTTTVTTSGTLPKSGTSKVSGTTAGGRVTATLTSASASVTLALLDSSGRVVATASGTSVGADLPAGGFTVQVKGAARTRWSVSTTYPV